MPICTIPKNMRINELGKHFSDACNRVKFGREVLIIERNKKPVAAMISCEFLELLEILEKEHKELKIENEDLTKNVDDLALKNAKLRAEKE